MAGRTRVVIIRLRQGGLLLVAPASVFPWPRILSRNARHLQPAGLRRAFGDAKAMQILRDQFSQMMNLPIARGAALMSDHELIRAYQRAADRGFLTMIFGHTEATYAEHPNSQHLSIVFERHPVIADQAASMQTPGQVAELPPKGTPMPKEYDARLMWTLARTPSHLDPGDYERFKEFFEPDDLPTTAALVRVWGSSHVTGIGFVVDASLFAQAIWNTGDAALRAFEDLKQFFDLTRDPSGWKDLDEAAEFLAQAISALGPNGFRSMLRRIGHGSAARGGDPTIMADSYGAPGSGRSGDPNGMVTA